MRFTKNKKININNKNQLRLIKIKFLKAILRIKKINFNQIVIHHEDASCTEIEITVTMWVKFKKR